MSCFVRSRSSAATTPAAVAVLGLVALLAAVAPPAAAAPPTQSVVEDAMKEGNWKDALDAAVERLGSEDAVPGDIENAVDCLGRLGRVVELDALIERCATRLEDDGSLPQGAPRARLMVALAEAYSCVPSYGHTVRGEFRRGEERGGGVPLNVIEADRVRALRLLERALDAAGDDRVAKAEALRALANSVASNRLGRASWRLQLKTDIAVLPDPEEGWGGAPPSDPPVAADGAPLLHEVPASWADAKNDGERWRWALAERARVAPAAKAECEVTYADFLYDQFDVSTLARWGFFNPQSEGDDVAAALQVQSLGDDESIARLATGVKRFRLPEGHRYLALYEGHGLWQRVAEARLNRRQRGQAAEALRKAIAAAGDARVRDGLKLQLDQVVRPWVRMESVETRVAGEGALLRVSHRNAKRLDFVARRIDVKKLLDDVRDALRDSAQRIDHVSLQVDALGWRLLQEGQDEYVGEEAGRWNLKATPPATTSPDAHADTLSSVATPLVEAGAYLVTATAEGGNTSTVVVWVADTALVRRPTADGALYAVVDAFHGRPIAGAQIDLFGYRWKHDADGRRAARVESTRLAETTDDDGFAEFDLDAVEGPLDNRQPYEWLAVATSDQGRLAHLGFESMWRYPGDDRPPNQPSTFVVTDRPIYRPASKVEFRAWVARPDYSDDGAEDGNKSPYAHQAFQVEIYDARGEKVWAESLTAGPYGALTGSTTLADDASLGVYRIDVVGFGGGTFRVEEYRKPEYEVRVEGPEKPTRLGEPFEAVVRADYFFGSPVAKARVKYRVLRTERSSRWAPPGPWDWLYGVGYGWLGQDAPWRSDWPRWGCPGPRPPWFPMPQGPPEVIAEGEAALDADGTLRIPIETRPALERRPNTDHEYEVTAEVTDASRRTIVGTGRVLAARRPLEVTLWLDRGHYEVGDTVTASVSVRTPDGKPVAGDGRLRLLSIGPPAGPAPEGEPGAKDLPAFTETEVQAWDLAADAEGRADLKVKASTEGRYRLVYEAKSGDETIDGGALFTIRGPGFDGSGFEFGDLELLADRAEYRVGETARLLVNTNRVGSAVAVFVRPTSGVYTNPKLLRLTGKSTVIEVPIESRDLPNLFVEATTVSDGKVHTVVRQLAVPPESRVLTVEAAPSASAFQPGQEGTIKVRLATADGKPLVGEATVAVYDKSVEAIAADVLPGDIRERFWSWRRGHSPAMSHNLSRSESGVSPPNEPTMQPLGVFGANEAMNFAFGGQRAMLGRAVDAAGAPAAAPLAMARAAESDGAMDKATGGEGAAGVAPVVRSNFADTALWVGSVTTDEAGLATIPVKLPDSLTAWRVKVWGIGPGARVGQGDAEVVTRKDLMARLQTPRFLVETDEAVLSAIINNYLPAAQRVRVRLELDGDRLDPPQDSEQTVNIEAGGEARIDWRVKARAEGAATVRVVAEATADGAEVASVSDAMQLPLPVLIHGAEIVESHSAVIGPDEDSTTLTFTVPEKRRAEQTRLEVRFTPSLVGAMLDALPYLIEYPHGCTEQTLNRFLPAVVTRDTLRKLGLDLAKLEAGAAPGEPNPGQRKQSPVFQPAELDQVVKAGVRRLAEMQLGDGGWGWFTGYGETSSPHTTATVVRGLAVAKRAAVAIPDGVLERGLDWLAAHREAELAALANLDNDGKPINDTKPTKSHADNLDALVHLVLAESQRPSATMRDRLFSDRLTLSAYSLAMVGLALDLEAKQSPADRAKLTKLRDRVVTNLRQFVVTDDENQSAYLNLGETSWWTWYGSDHEAHAYFLRLLSAAEPRGDLAPRIVKHLLASRTHGARWDSTRDTALVVEGLAEYALASDETAADVSVEVWLDGERRQSLDVRAAEALVSDGKFVVEGEALAAGEHTVEVRKRGPGRLYVGAFLRTFSLEDQLRAAGLEVKASRRVVKLERETQTGASVDPRGAAFDQRVEKLRRVEVPNLGAVESGDLVEVELTITSKNDYEYVLIEDPKAAGFEPVEARSGYGGGPGLSAYVEYRDARVLFFVANLPRGEHTLRYRLRAETPGVFSALPTQVSGMYAVDLRGNSDEIKVEVTETPMTNDQME
ncbi:MAG: alpha-2-macroglobulin family protein [Lacipirellulaceae bacterium]